MIVIKSLDRFIYSYCATLITQVGITKLRTVQRQIKQGPFSNAVLNNLLSSFNVLQASRPEIMSIAPLGFSCSSILSRKAN